MPNWCYTRYKCVGDKEELEELEDVIKNTINMDEPLIKNGFGSDWIGCVITALDRDWEKYSCRGSILDCYFSNDILCIDMETAWCEQEGFRQVIEEEFPNITVYWQDNESGCNNYTTNSFDYFPEKYNIEFEYKGLYGSADFKNFQEMIKYFKKILHIEFKEESTLKELYDFINNLDEDDWISIHSYELC